MKSIITEETKNYINDVKNSEFPSENEVFHLPEEELKQLELRIKFISCSIWFGINDPRGLTFVILKNSKTNIRVSYINYESLIEPFVICHILFYLNFLFLLQYDFP